MDTRSLQYPCSIRWCERDVLELVATAPVTPPTARRAIRDEVAVVGQRPHVQLTTLYAAEEQPLFVRCHIHISSLNRTQPSGGPESGVVIQRKPRPSRDATQNTVCSETSDSRSPGGSRPLPSEDQCLPHRAARIGSRLQRIRASVRRSSGRPTCPVIGVEGTL
jgi:hypothetical protein